MATSTNTPVLVPPVQVLPPESTCTNADKRHIMMAIVTAGMIVRHGRPLSGREDELAENAARTVDAILGA